MNKHWITLDKPNKKTEYGYNHMDAIIREIINNYNPTLLTQLESALLLRVTNFKRDLFPTLKSIDLMIPGAGFQYVIWVDNDAKYPFPGREFDAVARSMKYIPDYLAGHNRFGTIARAIANYSGGHVESCVKEFCETLSPPETRYQHLPLGTLAKRRRLIESLGVNLSGQLYDFAEVLVNKAKHDYKSGSPHPMISFPDALGSYFASRILGFQVLQKGGLLDKYVEAIKKAFSEGIVYEMPEGQDPGNDRKPWPLLYDLPEDEDA